MSAGLPGVGLSGAFFIVSALLMLPIEVVLTLRGRSSVARWGVVLRAVAIALTMIAGLELAYAVLHFGLTQLQVGRHANFARTVPVLPILGTLALVGIVIVGAKSAELLLRRRAPSARLGRAPSAAPHAQVAVAYDVDTLIDELVFGSVADTDTLRVPDRHGRAAAALHAAVDGEPAAPAADVPDQPSPASPPTHPAALNVARA